MPAPAFVGKNIEALKGRYPGIAKRLEGRSCKEGCLRIVRSSSGAPNLVAPLEGRFLMLYDPDEPIVQCRNYLDSLQMKFAPIVVFLGLGLGYHLSLFLRHYAERLGVRKVVVFEEDIDMLHFAIRHVDLHEIITHPDVQLFIGEDIEHAHLMLRRDIVMDKGAQNFMRGTRVIPLPVHIRLSPDYYRRAVQVTKRSFAQMMMKRDRHTVINLNLLKKFFKRVKNFIHFYHVRRAHISVDIFSVREGQPYFLQS